MPGDHVACYEEISPPVRPARKPTGAVSPGLSLSRRAWLAGAGATLAGALAGCGDSAHAPRSLSDVTLTIWHNRTTAENFMRAAGQTGASYRTRNADLPGGPALLGGYAAGALDYAYMSQIVAAFAVDAGTPLKIIATYTGDVNSAGILIQKASHARTIADLRGRTVAYTPATNEHYYLLKYLELAGLRLEDIQPVGLATSDINSAFTRGHVEARVTVGGIVALLAQRQLGARWLARSIGAFNSGNCCMTAHEDALADPYKRQAIADYLRREQATWDWIDGHTEEWARISAQVSEVPAELFRELAREKSRPARIIPPDDAARADFQHVTDDLARVGLLKGRHDTASYWELGII